LLDAATPSRYDTPFRGSKTVRMNRKRRRAMRVQGRAAGVDSARADRSAGPTPGHLFGQAVWHQHHEKPNEAIKLYKQVLALQPDHAEACNNLACVLLAQGKRDAASGYFERALILLPQLFDDFDSVVAMLVAVNPGLRDGMKRAASAWPQRLPTHDLLGSSFVAICADALLGHVLESTSIRNVDLERLLTSIRAEFLRLAAGAAIRNLEDDGVAFCCALAKQCFINEYVFAITPEEAEDAERLRQKLVEALTQGSPVPPLWPCVVAMYFPLHSLPNAQALLDRAWPAALSELLTQQLREPWEERQYRDLIPRLTTIEDDVSVLVKGQYEENPFPRWVHAASASAPITLDEHLRIQFPTAAFRPLGKSGIDVLVAGCGTGRHPIEVARQYRDARVLAVDLSLSSLCYAKRKTPATLAGRIEYAQADILELDSINRSFDLIEVSGVLHHLADPLAGWRALLSLLRPGGFMHVGLYSELARRDIVAARQFIADRGYRPTVEDIRRCRQDLLNTPLKGVAKAGDFFSTSECRDLLFHIQERRLTIPEIKSFLAENDLKFIGFEFAPRIMEHYRGIFGGDRFMRDLDRWHAFERDRPDTFAGMYQFWVQKN
jgi:SAM-dependent methyltransferase/tetratricopeptide (TPR) repeat protein